MTIRKTIQHFLKNKYDIDSKFLYHPFYPYPLSRKKYDNNDTDSYSNQDNTDKKTEVVSISRVDYAKIPILYWRQTES
jgi:hypothetical protein